MALKERNTHDYVVNKWLGKLYEENQTLKAQCVAWVKQYIEERFGIKERKSFGGPAYLGWENKNNSVFDSKKWNKVIYSEGKIPSVGSIVFFEKHSDNSQCGHVAIVHYGSNESVIKYIEQNGAGGRGFNIGDEIRINQRKYNYRAKVIGWYEPILKNGQSYSDYNNLSIQPNFNIWNEERPYDNVTKEEMDDMLIKAFGLNVDYYTIFSKYWKDLIRDPNATRVDYCTRAGRGNNTLTFENFGYKFDRMTIAKFIINIQTLWTGVELPIATESEVREIFFKYFPNQNPSDIFRRYFPEIQETNNFLFDIRRAWYQSNKIKNEFKHDRFYILSCILDMKKKLG